MVSQSDEVIVYRLYYNHPLSEKKLPVAMVDPAGGVFEEITEALLSFDKPVYVFHPRCDFHPDQTQNFFMQNSVMSRVEHFPKESKLSELPEDDSGGLNDLLEGVRQRVETHKKSFGR